MDIRRPKDMAGIIMMCRTCEEQQTHHLTKLPSARCIGLGQCRFLNEASPWKKSSFDKFFFIGRIDDWGGV